MKEEDDMYDSLQNIIESLLLIEKTRRTNEIDTHAHRGLRIVKICYIYDV